jgi:hypothetical protein
MYFKTLNQANSNWSVEEVATEEAGLEVEHSGHKFLTIRIQAGDDATARTKLDVMKQLANIVDIVVEERSDQKLRALVEALTPDVQFSPNKIIEARMLGQAIAAILASSDFVPASDIAEAAHFSSKNPSSQPNRWKRGGQIFAINYKGTDLYPFYALDPGAGLRPLEIMTDILKVFANRTGWQIAFWFASLNSYLNDKMPKDLLLSEPENVLRAAQMEIIGLQHG